MYSLYVRKDDLLRQEKEIALGIYLPSFSLDCSNCDENLEDGNVLNNV